MLMSMNVTECHAACTGISIVYIPLRMHVNEHERYRMPRGMHWNFHSIYTSSHALIRFRKFEIYDLILNPGD
jgi:hypothetical protein